MRGLVDIGANLLHTQFDQDRIDVLTRARTAGIDRVIITATNLEAAVDAITFLSTLQTRKDVPLLHSTVGIHPHDAAQAAPGWQRRVATLAEHADVVAIGETGLDFNRNFSPAADQRDVFAGHIDIAIAMDHPLFVHDRESHGEVLRMLQERETPPHNVVIHCFTGTAQELDDYLAAGYWIGITGWICDRRRGGSLRGLVPRIPLDRLLIETDAPFLLPHDLPGDLVPPPRGRRNEPAYLRHIAATLAHLLQVPLATLIDATATNALKFFRLPSESVDAPARP
jgi:TatD DNase family protein